MILRMPKSCITFFTNVLNGKIDIHKSILVKLFFEVVVHENNMGGQDERKDNSLYCVTSFYHTNDLDDLVPSKLHKQAPGRDDSVTFQGLDYPSYVQALCTGQCPGGSGLPADRNFLS